MPSLYSFRRLAGLVVATSCAATFGLVLRAQIPQGVNTWTSRGAIPQARTGAAAAVLDDGRTVIAGGVTTEGVATDSVVVFNPLTNEVSTVGRLLEPRAGHTVTLLEGNRLLVAGGTVNGVITTDIELVDLASGASTLVAALSAPRTGHAAATLSDGQVLIVGGATIDDVVLQSAELVDPETFSVSAVVGSLQVPRRDASATTVIDGRVLVIGGNDGAQDLASAEMFDPATGFFGALEPESHLSLPRGGHTAILLPNNNSVLIAGGRSNGVAVANADLFVPPIFPDPYTFGVGRFAPTGQMGTGRAAAVAGPAGSDGYALVIGGGPLDAEAYRYATIKTDKDDYAPGARAIITGAGWQPGEDVTLIFQEDPAVHEDYVLHVTADSRGDIYWDQWAPEQHDLSVRFYLTAVDSTSHAQITFTDSQPGGVVLTPANVSVAPGATAAYQVKILKNGNSDACAVTLTAVYTGATPNGAPFLFAGSNPVTMTTADVITTLTITTTNSGPSASRTQPGTYPIRVTATPGANCQGGGAVATADGTLVVTGGAVASTLSAAPATGTYGGTVSLSATLATSGVGVSGKSVAFKLNGNSVGTATTSAAGVATLTGVSLSGIDAGTYASGVTANFAGDAAVLVSSGSNVLTVSKADPAVSVDGFTGVYDGTAHGATGSATGVSGENLSALLNLGSTFTNVPGGTASWTFAGNGNYNSSTGTASITINKADAAVSVTGYTGVYDGTAHGATGTATGVGGANLSSLLTLGATFTNVPGGVANWTFTGNTNYASKSGSVNVVINKADANVAVTGYAGVYDGNAHGATGTATGVGGENLNNLLATGATFTNVPGGVANWSFAGNTNYSSRTGSVNIIINKADANVSVSGYTGVYDGNAHGATGTATGVKGESLSALLSLGDSFTNVPGGTASWSFVGDTNYKAANGTAAIVITKADATVSVTGYTGVYDGNAHGATGSATGVKGESLSALLNLGDSFTNVPGGTASWSFAGDTNYNTAGGTVAIVLTKADATVSVSGYTGVYDGNAHGATGSATGVKGESLSALLNLGDSFTNVPGGTASWSFAGDSNYNAASSTVAIVLSKADANVSVSGYTGVYDGNAHGATGTATGVKGESLSALLSLGDSFTNVPGGTASWSFAGDTNYNAASSTVAIVLTKADATVSVSGYTGVYDGNAHGATGSATGVKGESLSALLNLGDSFTNVPGGTASWSFAGDTNYNTASDTVAIVLTKADATVSVSGYTGVYDGNAHGATGTATGVKGESLSALLSLGDSFTNVPGGTASWSFAGDTNYNAANGTAAIVITKADATVSVTGYTGVYDGNAHGATGTATGVKGESLSALLSLGASFTNVPGGTASWSFAGDTNYNAASSTVAIVLTKADATVSVSGYTGVYDGNAHGATGSATGVKGESLSALLNLGDSFTNVPGGTASWSFAGDTNYNAANGTAAIVITKADATVSVTGYTGVYDGNAHSATGTATGVKGESLSALLSLGDNFTNVPGGTANWSFAGDTNYNAASGTATIVITKADATVSVTGYTGVYDGNAHGATGTAAGVKGENLNNLLHFGASFTNAPGGTASWSFDGDANYKATSGAANISIAKAAQVIAWATPAPIVYGEPLSGTQLNATLTTGDGALTYSPVAGAVLAVGQQVLQVSAAATTNYNAASKQVTLVVSPWHVTGFYSPVSVGGAAVVNTVKAGSTVPLKFNIYKTVGGLELTSISDIGAFQVYSIGCSAATTEDPIDFTTTGGTSLRYDATGRQFIQNWQTPKSAGSCYKVVMTAKDGTAIVAFFKTK